MRTLLPIVCSPSKRSSISRARSAASSQVHSGLMQKSTRHARPVRRPATSRHSISGSSAICREVFPPPGTWPLMSTCPRLCSSPGTALDELDGVRESVGLGCQLFDGLEDIGVAHDRVCRARPPDESGKRASLLDPALCDRLHVLVIGDHHS